MTTIPTLLPAKKLVKNTPFYKTTYFGLLNGTVKTCLSKSVSIAQECSGMIF